MRVGPRTAAPRPGAPYHGLTSQALSLTMGLRHHSYLASLVGLVLHLDEQSATADGTRS